MCNINSPDRIFPPDLRVEQTMPVVQWTDTIQCRRSFFKIQMVFYNTKTHFKSRLILNQHSSDYCRCLGLSKLIKLINGVPRHTICLTWRATQIIRLAVSGFSFFHKSPARLQVADKPARSLHPKLPNFHVRGTSRSVEIPLLKSNTIVGLSCSGWKHPYSPGFSGDHWLLN